MTLIDLDQAATAPTRRAVLEAMWPWLTGEHGNPSSTHGLGRRAAAGLAEARARIAALCGVRPAQVVLTSGGTEADNLAVIGLTLGAIARGRDRHIVVSAIEHEAVLESARYLERWHDVEVTVVPVNNSGLVDAHATLAALRPGTALLSVQAANNEVGTVQSLGSFAPQARDLGVVVHSDAVQLAGWYPLDAARNPELLTVDALTVSGHKLGAPKGVGALVLRREVPLEPLVHGGGQERDRRSGTENVAGAVGLATAFELAEAEQLDAVPSLERRRDALITQVLDALPEAQLTGDPERRLPCHASFVVPGLGGEPLLLALDERGILASSGSACAAGRDEPSRVLLAMGFDADTARTAIRLSWGASTTQDELDVAVRELRASAAELGRYSQG